MSRHVPASVYAEEWRGSARPPKNGLSRSGKTRIPINCGDHELVQLRGLSRCRHCFYKQVTV